MYKAGLCLSEWRIMVRIAIDCMGGDNAPSAIVKGALESLKTTADTKLFLFGPEEKIKQEMF